MYDHHSFTLQQGKAHHCQSRAIRQCVVTSTAPQMQTETVAIYSMPTAITLARLLRESTPRSDVYP